jgi:hypothetical protein
MRPSILLFVSLFTVLSACGETNVYDSGPGDGATDTAGEVATSDADVEVPDIPAPDADVEVPDISAPDVGEVAPGDLGSETDGDTAVADVEPACVPVTCESLGFDCGAIDNQCGNTLSCGLCNPPNVCGGGGNAQVCGCTPDCGEKTCGDDGCGGTCGICEAPTPNCGASGLCEEEPCETDCQGKDCGADGCGGTCGFCDAGSICDLSDLCEELCVPVCDGKECGPDGCEGSCGECEVLENCSATGLCELVCTPNCGNKECGPDGCGSSCGQCPAEDTCVSGPGGSMNCLPFAEREPDKEEK